MNEDTSAASVAEWATTSGDIWAERWRDTDAALEGLSPHLLSAVIECAPASAFKAFDIGCGPGSTAIGVADAFPEASIVACDISPALAEIAHQRTSSRSNIRVLVGDAQAVAASEGPFDLLFSRHGVMFFPDPIGAFRNLRKAANRGAALVFSCFQRWDSNPWASELANAAAGRKLPPPGREPSGFAFADPDYVIQILHSSGWGEAEPRAVEFSYVAGRGGDAVEHAVSFLSDLGPASRVIQSLPEQERSGALDRMHDAIKRRFDGSAVTFTAAAWVWRTKAIPLSA